MLFHWLFFTARHATRSRSRPRSEEEMAPHRNLKTKSKGTEEQGVCMDPWSYVLWVPWLGPLDSLCGFGAAAVLE
jgi:hypothetical protein